MHNYPLFASKQTSARIDFLRQGERLVNEKGTYYVKFLTENQTKPIMPYTHMWVMPQKARTLTTSSAGGCRAGHARPTKSASCKGRGMLPSTAGFQLVENTQNAFSPTPCWCTTTFWHIQMVQQLANSGLGATAIYFQQYSMVAKVWVA